MKFLHSLAPVLLILALAMPALHALEKQPASVYHQRRVNLADKLNGGVAILFAADDVFDETIEIKNMHAVL